jgi:hypothetical protein
MIINFFLFKVALANLLSQSLFLNMHIYMKEISSIHGFECQINKFIH